MSHFSMLTVHIFFFFAFGCVQCRLVVTLLVEFEVECIACPCELSFDSQGTVYRLVKGETLKLFLFHGMCLF